MKRTLPVISLLTVFGLGCAPGSDRPAAPLSIPTSPTFIGLGTGPPITGSGTGVITSIEDVSSRTAGNNVIKERRLTGTLSGSLQGTFTEEVRGVIHDGRVTFEGTLQVTGSVPQCGTGTFVLGMNGEGQAGLSPITDAKVRVIDHASNTVPVGGTGSVHQDGASLNYEIRYTCR
jgi:hypothetical protein